MFHSLKKQQRMHVPGQRRTISCKPIPSGRPDGSMATSEEADLIAISNAMRRRQPIYFIRSGDGVTLDVVLDKTTALRTRDAMRTRSHNGRLDINAYERIGTALVRI